MAREVILKKIEFEVNSVVYIITDVHQLPCQVIAVHLTPNGYLYQIRHADEEPSIHYNTELSTEKTLTYFKPAE